MDISTQGCIGTTGDIQLINNSDKGSGNTLLSSSRSYRKTIKSPQYLSCIEPQYQNEKKGKVVYSVMSTSYKETMEKSMFIKADEAAELLGISRSMAYKLIRKMNNELEAQGYMTLRGRVNRSYFNQKFYDGSN